MKTLSNACTGRILAALALAVLSLAPLAAEGIATSAKLDTTVTTVPEMKTRLSLEAKVPFLAGDGALTKNNNARFTVGAELTPVSMKGTLDAVWTPIAFVELVGGASVGSGWNVLGLNGLRMNERSGLHDNELSGGPFLGAVWSVKGGAALQGDFAAIRDGPWNHVIFRTYHAGMYRALSSASADESWLFEADRGESRNGWNYYGNYLLAYRMPVKLNLVGILVEEDLYLFDTEGREFWGDDVSRWTLSLMGSYAFTERLSLMGLVQARTVRNFVGDTGDYGFYQDRELDADDERRLEFYRVIATLSWKLR